MKKPPLIKISKAEQPKGGAKYGVHVLRIYPALPPGVPREHPSLFVRALVFDTRKALKAFWKASHLRGNPRAVCQCLERYFYRDGVKRRDPAVANVSFWRGEIGAAIVAHEFLHAAFAFAKRAGWPLADIEVDRWGTLPLDGTEEKICYVHGDLVGEFNHFAYQRKLYRGQ